MTKYIKNFDEWNKRKQKVDAHETGNSLYVKEREVWWVSVGVNIGTEIDGKHDTYERPVLVFRKVGREQFYGLPLTSKSKTGPFYRLVKYGDREGSVCLSQMRIFSTKRLLRKIGRISESEQIELQELFAKFFKGERL